MLCGYTLYRPTSRNIEVLVEKRTGVRNNGRHEKFCSGQFETNFKICLNVIAWDGVTYFNVTLYIFIYNKISSCIFPLCVFFLYWRAPQQMLRKHRSLEVYCATCDEDDKVFSAFPFWWNTGGLKLTGENRSTRRKTCPSATLSTINPTWTDPGSNPASAVRGRRLTTWARARPSTCVTRDSNHIFYI